MPGFSIGNNGGGGPSNTVETLRENRWIIRQLGPVKPEEVIYAKELTLPEIRIDRYEVLGGLLYYKFAKSVKWEDAIVTFYDTGKILNELTRWRDLVYTNEEGIKSHSPAGGYKKTCEFLLLGGADINEPINVITLENAWPATISHGRLSYTSSEIKIVTVNIAYDYSRITKA